MSDYAAILAFDTDDERFVHGFECGRIWALLAQHDRPIKVLAHKVNAEMLLRMAEATGRHVQTTDLDDDENEYDHVEAVFSAAPVEA